MKLGVGVNIFSGLELLEPALLQIREHVHYIVGVFDRVSFEGDQPPPYYFSLLEILKNKGLIDDLIEHTFNITYVPLEAQSLQREKSELGRKRALENECTHYLNMDCDEFYNARQFKESLQKAKDYEFTITCLFDYVKSPICRAKTISKLHCPFLIDINKRYMPCNYPVLLDLSRTVSTNNYYIFNPDDLVMHHFTGVRFNEIEIERKFQGHSHYMRMNESNRLDFYKILKGVDSSNYIQVEDQFNILKYWNTEFSNIYNSCTGK
jgi:hypothetical protein